MRKNGGIRVEIIKRTKRRNKKVKTYRKQTNK
jgi:hypothetical protein